MGVACGYVAPLAGLVRSQGFAVIGRGWDLICVGALAGLGGFDSCRLGFGAVECSGARWRALGVLRLPVCSVSSGRGPAWHPAAVAG